MKILIDTKRHKNGRDIKAIAFQGIAEAMADQWGSDREAQGYPSGISLYFPMEQG